VDEPGSRRSAGPPLHRPPDLRKAAASTSVSPSSSRVGAEILFLPRDDETGLDSIYVRDAVVVSEWGAILCNMGRRNAPRAGPRRYFEAAGIPIAVASRMKAGWKGNVVFLDARTVAVGQDTGRMERGSASSGDPGGGVDDLIPVPLPH